MIEVFFTEQGAEFWRNQSSLTSSFYKNLLSGKFSDASTSMHEIKAAASYRKAECLADVSDAEVNDYFIAETTAEVLEQYGRYWNHLVEGRFADSWCVLQDLQGRLRTLLAHVKRPLAHVLQIVEQQCGFLEGIYPYKIFFSVEMIVEDMICSICRRNTLDPECLHLLGDLYRGEIAYGEVINIRELQGFALVQNPLDKRCVVTIPDTDKRFAALAYLQEHLKTNRFNPLVFEKVERTTVEECIKESNGSARNKPCPCGSGKKLKQCCLHRGSFSRDHIEFVGVSTPLFVAMDV